jgi:hypothetical protein
METYVMKALLIASLVTAGIGTAAFAQKRTAQEMVNDMKASHGQTFEDCQALATARGYRLSDDEYDSRTVAMFIEGCIMGRQH